MKEVSQPSISMCYVGFRECIVRAVLAFVWERFGWINLQNLNLFFSSQ